MLRHSLTLLALMFAAWGLVLWTSAVRADSGVTLGPVDKLIMTSPQEQVPTVGVITVGPVVVSGVWTSPTRSTSGLLMYADNGEYTYLDMYTRGGGLFVHVGDMVDDGTGRLKPQYAPNGKWGGFQSGQDGVGFAIRQQVWGDYALGPISVIFSEGDGTTTPLRNDVTWTWEKGKTTVKSALCWENGFCLNATSSQTIALIHPEVGIIQEWHK